MNFLTRFLIVLVWLMGISATAFAFTERCTKNKKDIAYQIIKTRSQNTNHTSSGASNKSAASCTGSVLLYCIKNEPIVIPSSYSNQIIYKGLIIHPPLSGFKSQPYSPPRQILNL